jgi:hypothetical protein
MRIIKLGLISIIVFSLLITGISLFFPSHIRISKAIEITASKESIMSQIGDASNWKNWYPGADKSTFIYVEGKIKGITSGNKQDLVIKEVNDSAVLTGDVVSDFKKRESGWNVFPGRTPNTLTVQWFMDFHLQWYPWEKFSSLLLEKRYGTMMEQGLTKLKNLLEK